MTTGTRTAATMTSLWELAEKLQSIEAKILYVIPLQMHKTVNDAHSISGLSERQYNAHKPNPHTPLFSLQRGIYPNPI